MFRKFLLACLILTSPVAFAQTAPSAEGPAGGIWVGAEFSTFNPDYGCTNNSPFSCWNGQLQGIGAFADVNRLVGRVGLEGEARWLLWRGPGDNLKQSNYLVGPRIQLVEKDRFSLHGKILVGGAILHLKDTWQGWVAFAPGGTIGYRISSRLMVRGDYEYQMWPGFVGVRGPHGLTPNGLSAGFSYQLTH